MSDSEEHLIEVKRARLEAEGDAADPGEWRILELEERLQVADKAYQTQALLASKLEARNFLLERVAWAAADVKVYFDGAPLYGTLEALERSEK